MRGFYHQAMLRILLSKSAERALTHESLAQATGKDTSTIGKYLRQAGSGTLDLDEADAALRHVGATLKEFVLDPAHIPPLTKQGLSRQHRRLLKAIAGLDETHLQVIVATAQSVRAAAKRAGTLRAARRVADPAQRVRKTGGTR